MVVGRDRRRSAAWWGAGADRGDRPWRLVVSDMEGTLVSGTTTLAYLSTWLGYEPIVEGLEGKLAQCQISDREVAETYARSYRAVALADAVLQMTRIPRMVSARFTARVARHFRPGDKAAFVEQYCREAGIGMDRVVAVGDSRSDLPLFRVVAFSIALNATQDARAAAPVAVDSLSFLSALQAVPRLIS